jgi:hypothetical protein
MTSTYRVVVQGLTDERDRAAAALRLAALFKSGPAGVARLLERADTIVKQNLTEAAAQRYGQALAACGCRVRIELVAPDFAAPDFAAIDAAAPQFERFRKWRAEAEGGDAQAQYHLGRMYRDGEGTPSDVALAAEWLRKSAEQGNTIAQYHLGVMYTDGTLPHDVLAAYRWMRIADFCGQPEARAAVEALEPVIPLRDKVLARIVARDWIRRSRGMGADESTITDAQLRSVMPVLRRARHDTLDDNPPVVKDVAGEIAVSFTIDEGGQGAPHAIRRGMLARLCMNVDELYALAGANRIDGVADDLGAIPAPAAVPAAADEAGSDAPSATPASFRMLRPPDGAAAGLITSPGAWSAMAKLCQGAVRVAVPVPGLLLFCGADETHALMAMRQAARDACERAGAEGLSAQVFALDEAGVLVPVPVDHGAAGDSGDGMSSSPAAAHPGRLALSEARLARLQPELLEPAARGEDDSARQTWLASIRGQLASGDSRAAVVIDAENAVVAAYTDEIDCVALLKFDPAVAQANRWKMGARLLTVNSYLTGDEYKARDLLPGENANLGFKNFRPLIADLLTDDRERLDSRKAEIGEEEWLRAMVLGKQAYLDRAVPPRDGRPLSCAEPARPARTTAVRKRRTGVPQPSGIGGFFKVLGGLLLCVIAIIVGLGHIGALERGPLFYAACFGIFLVSQVAACLLRVLYYWAKPD